ncbi:hypothetical protein WISP_72740 [Willisornis vidua]|uniref:Uncharacterized protein n=1 Tax=Willisornis vidua TaxID=1566151 RepID=A0ABQ9DD57_9PASS|nr:hypothetical protein WISP_72740 [Willisornis vidua]
MQMMHISVHIQFNCIEVNVAQHIYVTMKTIPNYCEVKLSQEYYVEAGKFDYNVDRARKLITVNVSVSNFARDQDYYVRLCHKWFTCEDVGAFAVFTTKQGSWIKCPFAHGEFPGRFCINPYVTGNVWVNNLHSGFHGQSYGDGNPAKAMTHSDGNTKENVTRHGPDHFGAVLQMKVDSVIPKWMLYCTPA